MVKFTIRDLLLLTVIVAMGVAWALRERQHRAERRDLRSELKTAVATTWVMWQEYRELPGARQMMSPYSEDDLKRYLSD